MLKFISINNLTLSAIALMALFSSFQTYSMEKKEENISKIDELEEGLKQQPRVVMRDIGEKILEFYDYTDDRKEILDIIKNANLDAVEQYNKVESLVNALKKRLPEDKILNTKAFNFLFNEEFTYENATASLLGHSVMGPKNRGGNPQIVSLFLSYGANPNKLIIFDEKTEIFNEDYIYTFEGTPLGWIFTHLYKACFGSVGKEQTITISDECAQLAIKLVQTLLNPNNIILTNPNIPITITSNRTFFGHMNFYGRNQNQMYTVTCSPLMFLIAQGGQRRAVDIEFIKLLVTYEHPRTRKLLTDLNLDKNFIRLVKFANNVSDDTTKDLYNDFSEIIDLCLKHPDQIDFNIRNRDGKTALNVADDATKDKILKAIKIKINKEIREYKRISTNN